MRKVLLLFLLLNFGVISMAQNIDFDTTVYVFKLTPGEAESLYQTKQKLSENYFHTVIDSFSSIQHWSRKIPAHGHYLTARAIGEKVFINLESYQTISAVSTPNKRDLHLQVYDSLGNSISNARVSIDDKIIPYNEDLGGYFKTKWKKEGLLKIVVGDETCFYHLELEDGGWNLFKERYRYFARGKFGRVVTSPIRWGKGFYYYVKGAIQNRRFTPPFIYRIRNIRYRRQQLKGYIATHQPTYQPKDTVKVMAYIANSKGKPLKKEMYLKLVGYSSGYQTLFDIPIQPERDGVYTYEFPLGDSLTLDKRYTLTFYKKEKTNKKNKSRNRRNRNISELSQQFGYEDYQLDEVSWSLDSSKEKFQMKDPVIFYAEGKDANGNTIPDGQIELTLLAGNVSKHYTNPMYVPDTIWQTEMPLKTRGRTQIMVPDSLLPNANMQVYAQAKLTNANGEIHQQNKTINISRSPNRIFTEIKNGYLLATYFKNGKSVDTNGTIEYQFGNTNNSYTTDTITYPLKKRVNPYVQMYSLYADSISSYLNLGLGNSPESSAGVSINGQWKGGQAEFRLNNPNQIPVQYTIRTKDRVVIRDSSAKSEIIFVKNKYQGVYYIYCSYVWGGQTKSIDQTLRPYKKQLNISITQDNKVKPGDLVHTEIEVLDFKDRPAKGVNLAAGSFNSQFKEKNNFTPPNITYKQKRAPFEFSNFKLKEDNGRIGALSISPFFYEKLDLKDHFFYSMRFENEEGLILKYDSLTAPQYQELAQIAPYIIDQGKEVPIEMIYLNSKLVYYAGTNINQPYSFIGFNGRNQVTLRTRQSEFTFRDIILKKGHKLEMVVDLNTISKSTNKDRYSVKAVSKSYSEQEKKILNFSLFQYKDIYLNNKYIWQDNGPVFIIPPSPGQTNYTLGPFIANQNTGFVLQDQFIRNFQTTPGFIFEIYQDQERLYANELFPYSYKVKQEIPEREGYHRLGQAVHTIADIVTVSPKRRKLKFKYGNFGEADQSGGFNYQIPNDSILLAIVVTDSQDSLLRVLQPNNRQITQLGSGQYNLHFLTSNQYHAVHKFEIKPQQTLYENLTDLKLKRDSVDGIFENLISSVEPIKAKYIDPFTAQFTRKKQIGIFGKINIPVPDSTLQNFEIRLLKDDLFVASTATDSTGHYSLKCYPGIYELEITHKNKNAAFEFPVFLTDSSSIRLDFIFYQNAFYLNQIEVIGYKQSLLRQDETMQGGVVTSDEIRNLPTRSINGLAGTVAGVGSSDDGGALNIRGGRVDGTVYYVDGVEVGGNLIPESAINQTFEIPIQGTVTDSEGEPIMFGSVMLIVGGQVVAGTTTNIDGQYFLRVPDGFYELEASYIGYTTVRVSNTSTGFIIDIALEEGNALLDEVVVVGYSSGTRINKQSSLSLKSLEEDDAPSLEGGVQLRSDFKDYAYWQPNLKTDKRGKVSFQTIFPDKLTSWRTFVVGMDKKERAGVAYSNTKSFKPLTAQLLLPRFLIEGDQSQVIGKSVNYTKSKYSIETSFQQDGNVIQSKASDLNEALIETAKISAQVDQDSTTIIYDLKTGEYGDGEEHKIPVFPNGITENVGGFYVLEGDTSLQINPDPLKGSVIIYAQGNALDWMIEDIDYLVKYPYGCNEQTASRLTGLLLQKQIKNQLSQPFENEAEVIKMIVRLKKNQNEDGSWGWWSNNPRNQWITIHVLKVLAKAKEAGYTTTAFDKGIRFATTFFTEATVGQQVQLLELFSSIDQIFDYDKYLNVIDTVEWGLKEQFTIIKIKQEQDLEIELDSLYKYKRIKLFGGVYWGRENYNIVSEDVNLTLSAYQIFKNVGNQKELRAIRQFFIMRRAQLSQSYGRRFGRNTMETALILATLLPDMLQNNQNADSFKSELTITGSTNETINQFPFKKLLAGDGTIRVSKKGAGIIYFTAYQEFLNRAPESKSDLFTVNTKLIQENKSVTTLKQGERVTLKVDLEADKDADYIMVEIPIPAGCSFFSKPHNQRGVEVHREYYKNKVAIFCRRLSKGDHQFTVDLEVRFAGTFSLLPTKVEQMYFPVFYGRNTTKEVLSE